MSVQGNDPSKYEAFVTSANQAYLEVKQGATETYQSVKNSALANEFSKILPRRDPDKPASEILKQSWPVRSVNNALTVASALYKSFSSQVARNTLVRQTTFPSRKPLRVESKKAETLESIKQQATTLDAQTIFDELKSGTLCSSLVEKHGILQLNEKVKELHTLLEDAKTLGTLSSKEISALETQLKDIREISMSAKAMLNDHYPYDFINEVATFQFRAGEGQDSAVSKLPEKLQLRLDPKTGLPDGTGVMVDSSGKAFGDIRGKDGATEKFFEVCNQHGGDSRIIKQWMSDQGGGTKGSTSQVMKYELFMLRQQQGEKNYWSGTFSHDGTLTEIPIHADPKKPNEAAAALENALPAFVNLGTPPFDQGDIDKSKKTIQTTLAAWTAYNLEFYRKTEMNGVNWETQTQTLIRTESPKGVRSNKIPLAKTAEGTFRPILNKMFKMKRDIYESASREAPVFAAGTAGRIITVQEVPLHRCIFTYQLYKLKSDDEMEVGFITDDIKFQFRPDEKR